MTRGDAASCACALSIEELRRALVPPPGLRIALKLTLGFACLTALVLLTTGLGVWSGGALARAHARVADQVVPRVIAAGQLKGAISDAHFSQTEYVLTNGAKRSNFIGDERIAAASLAALQRISRGARDENDVAAIAVAFAAWERLDAHLYATLRARGVAAATPLVTGEVNDAVDAVVEAADHYVVVANRERSRAVASFASTRSRVTRLELLLGVLAVALAIAIAVALTRSMNASVSDVLDRLRSLREHCVASLGHGLDALRGGDLTVAVASMTTPITRVTRDELGEIAEAVNDILDRTAASIDAYNGSRDGLSQMLGEVAVSAESVAGASAQMASSSGQAAHVMGEIAVAVGEVATGAERQVGAVESVSSASRRMTQGTVLSADRAHSAAHVAEQALATATEGATAVALATDAMAAVREASDRATTTMSGLGARSDAIEGIVQVIAGIAAQTNLLAIEAARAGEHGRGFAVVADEVGKLAEESQRAASSIAGLITEIQTETQAAVEVVQVGAQRSEQGAATVEQARAAFAQIGEHVTDMTQQVQGIAAAVQEIATTAADMSHEIAEVAAVAEQTSASTEQVSASTQETSASTQQITAGATALAGTAGQLRELVGRFTLAL
jgi:methyl-accepting chemotaxis protein